MDLFLIPQHTLVGQESEDMSEQSIADEFGARGSDGQRPRRLGGLRLLEIRHLAWRVDERSRTAKNELCTVRESRGEIPAGDDIPVISCHQKNAEDVNIETSLLASLP